MSLFEVIARAMIATDIAGGFGGGHGAAAETGELVFRHLQDGIVGDRARGHDHHAIRAVVGRHEVVEVLATEMADGLLLAEDGPAHRLGWIDDRLEVIEDEIVRRVAGLAKLLKDDLAFALQLGLVEGRAHQDVGQDIEGKRDIGLQRSGVEGCLLPAGVGVEEAADGFHLDGDVAGGAALGALEGHVLEHVGHTHHGLGFLAGAGIDPDADEGTFQLRHWISYDHQPIGKFANFYIHWVRLLTM